MAYSLLYNFRWRAAHIRNQAEKRYDDVSGPLALFGIITVAVLINTDTLNKKAINKKDKWW